MFHSTFVAVVVCMHWM